MKGKNVFVGLSGGVDSAVSAALLKEQGYRVTGVFLKNWSGDDYGLQENCPWEIDQQDAEAVCKTLNIEFRSYNFEKEYRDRVVKYFFSEYQKGRTPNPDVMCNKEIKFKLFLEKAIEDGADYIATGHYARILSCHERSKNCYSLLKGVDTNKDQTYFIYNLNQSQLSKILFPIGHLKKTEVRKLAEQYNLPNAKKPDSQGICFIGEINVLKFLMSKIPLNPGDFIDIDSAKKVGLHNGVYFYTIGQRDGLKLGGQKVPYYVVSKDIEKNIVYVGHGSKHPKMYKNEVMLENLHLINPEDKKELEQREDLTAALRYRQVPVSVKVKFIQESILCNFKEPVRAPASGQSLVLYSKDHCLGGGIIV